ncbi:hypothetical protein [Fusibacter sp. 3D3]|uniref:hypothetical protein n=1 Tax=Fusibacter sp. 3D3 TaxID=1048380 RepID=UPI0008583A7F|nr:hypothetical protein [Fusibacter sp. 3D3]GAU77615.1 citrate lyase alpha chain [Fusibacter sp. 3D3]
MSSNKNLPKFIEGYGAVKPYAGPFVTAPLAHRYGPKLSSSKPGESKMVSNIKEVLEKSGIQNGMTISFHHH